MDKKQIGKTPVFCGAFYQTVVNGIMRVLKRL